MTVMVIPTGGLLYQARVEPSTHFYDANDTFCVTSRRSAPDCNDGSPPHRG